MLADQRNNTRVHSRCRAAADTVNRRGKALLLAVAALNRSVLVLEIWRSASLLASTELLSPMREDL
jgi:hypothetical protein